MKPGNEAWEWELGMRPGNEAWEWELGMRLRCGSQGTEEQAVLVSGVVGGQVVEVKDADPEHREVGTDA